MRSVLAHFVLWISLLGVSLGGVAEARARRVSDFTRDGRPNIQSAAAYVMDFRTNRALYERDADVVRPVASLSKLMAALVYKEQCPLDPDGLHEMTPANRDAAKGGDKTRLVTGWSYSHRDLLHAALMRSDNRALPALGEACGMDVATYASRMTARARSLGLSHTYFAEPTGLSPDNVSTAREMMAILREVLKDRELAGIMSTRRYVITAIKKEQVRKTEIHNTDRLLAGERAEIIGGKTGYTDLARYCFAVAARISDSIEAGMVFLGGEGRHTRFADFNRVARWLERGGAEATDLAARAERADATCTLGPVCAGPGASDVTSRTATP